MDSDDHVPGGKCFVCNGNSRLASGLGRKLSGLSSTLDSQLPVILLLRKILGIKQDVITELLKGEGNPSEWGIKLCGSCLSVFREAEFVYRRLLKFQADFEELAKELRSLLLSSAECSLDDQRNTSDPPENAWKAKRKMGRPKRMRTTDKKIISNTPSNIVENLRRQFVEGSTNNTLDPLICDKVQCSPKNGTGPLLYGKSSPVISKLNSQESSGSNSRTRPSRSRVAVQIQEEDNIVIENNVDQTEDTFSDNDTSESHFLSRHPVIVKQEAGNNELQELDYEGDDDALPSSPAWFPENEDENEMEDFGAPEDEGDSDYEPTSSKPKVKSRGQCHKTKRALARHREKQLSESLSKTFNEISAEPIEDNGKFKCSTCDKRILRKMDCRAHILKDHYDDPLPFHCHVCENKRFVAEKNLRKHLYRFHTGAKTPYDEDYDPELHSVEKLKTMVVEDGSWQSFSLSDYQKDNQTGDLQEIVNPQLPEDVLEQFRNDPKGTYQCNQCKRKFASEMLRDGHEKRTHQGIENPFQCTRCHRVFARRSRLLKHMVVVHFSNQHVCSQCGLRFADKVLMEGHIRRIHLGETNPYPCSICPRKFPKRVKLNQHLAKVHKIHIPKVLKKKVSATMISVPQILRSKSTKEEDSIFECWVCSTEGEPMRFNSLQEKEEHMQTLHTSVEKPFKCPAEGCDKRYTTHGILDYHLSKVHPEGIKVLAEQYYECVECKKKFSLRSKLEAHMETHSSSPFVCDLCGKQYRIQKYLDDHQQQIHHKELKLKPHKCKHCGKVLNTAKSLDHHIRAKHTKETKFKCTECDFGTMYEKLLQRHVEIRHLKLAQALCPICSRPFATQFYLTQHMMRVHSKEKPYKCNDCGKLFSDQPTFNRHKEAHSGRIHECPIENCKRQYTTRHAFRNHLKNHQKNGIMVEIPEFRYENDSEKEEEDDSSPSTARVEATSDNSFNELPDLKPEANLVEQSTNFDKDTFMSNTDDQPPPLDLVNQE